ncbi:unnamed protein product [Rhizophagus irregularis]|nr:unnamed protein product [Rhizophagus irregularis]
MFLTFPIFSLCKTFGVFKLRILDIVQKVWNGRNDWISFRKLNIGKGFGQPLGLGILENGSVSGNIEIWIMASDFELWMVMGKFRNKMLQNFDLRFRTFKASIRSIDI